MQYQLSSEGVDHTQISQRLGSIQPSSIQSVISDTDLLKMEDSILWTSGLFHSQTKNVGGVDIINILKWNLELADEIY